ncbi:Obscurin [Gryllus bimaculatus]|nr:Obscurin [Gryllus bimaculatus]
MCKRFVSMGRELVANSRVCISTADGESQLTLRSITADDSGKYVVSIENVLGADCYFASVAVEGPPDPPAGKPTVSPCTGGAIVAWSSAPYDGGCMITGYSVEMQRVGDDEWQQVASGCHSLSNVVSNLSVGENYVFRVRAENVHGLSEPSAESSVFSLDLQSSAIPDDNEDDECFTPAFSPRLVTIEPGEDFKNRFEVLEELGKGRYGVVHKVAERSNGQKFAAKFIRCIKAKDKEKVQEEIDIMNCLRHPKLLQLAAAFETPREMVMVMEYISGGELFERVVADDFTLTERDCILFMRQICEGVSYMHENSVVHLDLKPENIMCHTRTSHQIKLIDFGLARKLQPDIPVRVLFGTPEFIPPEIISYEPISVESDMWSVGVICYVLLSGLSPFMGDNDAETFANITRADYDFEDESFDAISQDAKDFISSLLLKRKEDRLTAQQCLKHIWLAQKDDSMSCVKLSTDKLKKFIIRRKWQKTGNAIRALGRMATLSAASRRNSNASSTSGSPRPSLSGGGISRMSSLNEEDREALLLSDLSSTPLVNTTEILECHSKYANHMNGLNSVDTSNKSGRMRLCSERSDSGIGDCSSIASSPQVHQPFCQCHSKLLMSKKFSITEEAEYTIENQCIGDIDRKTEVLSISPLPKDCVFIDSKSESENESSKSKDSKSEPSDYKSTVTQAVGNMKANLSHSSSAESVKKTTCLKQQGSVDSGVHMDVGAGSVMNKVQSYVLKLNVEKETISFSVEKNMDAAEI